ncbi:MAG: ATP-binding cassette domain-containing protein [Anaerolineae bacterium]
MAARASATCFRSRACSWRTAVENVAAALQAERINRADAHHTALDWLQRVGLADFVGYYPAQLGGGMQQRAALARAFAVQPDILLLDEPFSHLDEGYKQELLDTLRRLVHETGVTVVYVTHDLRELDGLASHTDHLDAQQSQPERA